MTDSIADIQVHVSMDIINIKWNMLIQNHQYLWSKDALIVRLFCPAGIELDELSTTKSLGNFQSSETDTHIGEISVGVSIINATSGVNKSYETARPVVQNYGLVHENDDDAPHYRFSIDMAKLSPPMGDGYEQFPFTWKIRNIQDATRDFQIRIEFGHLVGGSFQKEYVAQRNISLPLNNQDAMRQWLERVLTAINSRLNATIYGLDSIFLDLEMGEEPGAVVQSQLFKSYVVDIQPPNSSGEEKPINFDEAFEKYNHRLLLLGNAGAGKSTVVAVFTKNLIEKRLKSSEAKIPIYTPITNWRGETSIRNWIVQETQLPSAVQEKIDSGQVIFLLDGLDEIPSSIEQVSASPNMSHDFQVKFLEKLREELFGNDVVITCRDAVYKNLQSRNQGGVYLDGAVAIQPLIDDQIRSYLHRQPDLWDVLQKDGRLLDLVRTPLLLRIFAVAFKGISDQARELALIQGGDGALRDEVFRVYVRQRCVHEAQKQPARFPTERKIIEWIDKIYDVLGKVAAQGHQNGKRHIEAILGNETEDFINQMCDLHILMRTETGDIQFIHLLLEYHFAWEPLLADLKKPNPDWSTLRRLGEIRDRRAVQPLIHALENSFGFAGREFARSLGEIGDPEAIPALTKLLSHRDRSAREQAVQALGLIRDARAIHPLIDMLDDSDVGGYPSTIQKSAVWALEQIGETAIEPLCNSLNDERINVRTEAARTLAFIKNERASIPLIEALVRSESRIEVPYPGFVSGYVDPTNTLLRVDERLGEFIHIDRDISMYVFALASLGRAAIEPLINLYQAAETTVKAAAIWALAQIEDEQLVDFFLGSLKSDDDKVRSYSVYGLAKNCGLVAEKNDRPVLPLINVINERPISAPLFNCTIWTLGVLGHPMSVNAVVHYLAQFSDDHSRSKFHAIGGLGLSSDTRATSTLIPFLKDSDYYVRVCAAEALGRLKDTKAVDALLSSLDDQEWDVRRHTIEALGKIGDKRATKSLVSHFADNVHSVSQALGELDDQSIIPDLSSIAQNHEQQYIRQAASNLIHRLRLQSG